MGQRYAKNGENANFIPRPVRYRSEFMRIEALTRAKFILCQQSEMREYI